MNYGLKIPQIDSTHYVFGNGNFQSKLLRKDGKWGHFLSPEEKQSTPEFDTFNCTAYGTANMIEAYLLVAFGVEFNVSERWIGIISKTKGGNDPHLVMEAIRKFGIVKEESLPFDDTITTEEEYYSFKGGNEAQCYEEGKKWLEKYDFKHDWVFLPTQPKDERDNNMRAALKYSPLGVAVYAWATDERGIYVSIGQPNHWVMLYEYSDYQRVFDSYDPFRKRLNQDILYCKRIYIEEKKQPKVQRTFVEWIIYFFNLYAKK